MLIMMICYFIVSQSVTYLHVLSASVIFSYSATVIHHFRLVCLDFISEFRMVNANDIEKCLKSVGSSREKYVLKLNAAAKADVWKNFLLGKSAYRFVCLRFGVQT
jgi:hypothetical protein